MSDLPTGWRQYEFGELFDVQGGSQPAKKHFVYEPQDGYIRLLQIRDFGAKPVPTYVPRHMVTKFCTETDILIARYGASLGRILSGMSGAYNVALAKVILDENITDRQFVLYWLNRPQFQHSLQSISRSAQSGFNKDDIFPILVHLPPLPEQVKIAGILHTWDRAIALAERRIEAALQRKRSLMQRLLTGRVRFLEFKGDAWKEARLEYVFTRVRRRNTRGTPNILSITANVGFEHQSEKFGRVIAGKNLSKYTLLKRGEFAYNKGNSLSYPQGCVYLLEEYDEAAVPNVYYCFGVESEAVHAPFYKYYFESGALNAQLMRVINTGVRNDGLLNLSADDFFNCQIAVPPLAEQRRIAAVMQSCDRELELLRKKRGALQCQKKGLMQRLLTGRVRVSV